MSLTYIQAPVFRAYSIHDRQLILDATVFFFIDDDTGVFFNLIILGQQVEG